MALPPALASLMRGTPALPRAAGPATPPAAAGAAPAAGASPVVPDEIFSQIANQRFADSAGADPDMGKTQLKQTKAVLLAMLPKYAFRVPDMEKHLTAANRAIDMALKAIETFTSQQQMQQPIDNTAANAAPVGSPTGLPG